MFNGTFVREVTRDLLVQLVYLPPVILCALYLSGTWRIVTLTFVMLAAFMTADAVRGKFGQPATPSAITRCLFSNALFIAILGTAIAFGLHVL